MGRLAIATSIAGGALLLVATIVALASMKAAEAAPGAGAGGMVALLGAAVGLSIAALLWIVGNLLMLVSYRKSRGMRSKSVAGACFLASLLHVIFLLSFIGVQGARMSFEAAIVSLIALLLAVGYGLAGVSRLRGPRQIP